MPNNSINSKKDIPNQKAARKSPRRSCASQKYIEYLQSQAHNRNATHDNSSSDDDDDSGDQDLSINKPHKPTALYNESDVDEQYIFKFKSRHKKNSLQSKVQDVINSSSRFLDVPRNSFSLNSVHSTPAHVNEKIKKRIVHEVASECSDGDFNDSSTEYIPDGSNDEDETSQSEATEEELRSVINKDETSQSEATEEELRSVINKVQPRKSKDSQIKVNDCIVAPDNYFIMNSSKKISTSNHTLAKLRNLSIDGSSESIVEISLEHEDKIEKLNDFYELLFDKWLLILNGNFNIILYGIGSKRQLLQKFYEKKLKGCHCVLVNGYFPSVTLKSILDTIMLDFLGLDCVPSSAGEVKRMVEQHLKNSEERLFLLVNNIDGLNLRNSKAQVSLADLAQIKEVHLIATVDHIHAPLLWDLTRLSQFNFSWWDVTTFSPYTEEISFENNLMQNFDASHSFSLQHVYGSLTKNAKGIFEIIVKYQLDNYKPNYQGLPFNDLYTMSRERFLVSSDVALRAQLTEFVDHELIKIDRGIDIENLIVPHEKSLLEEFLRQVEMQEGQN